MMPISGVNTVAVQPLTTAEKVQGASKVQKPEEEAQGRQLKQNRRFSEIRRAVYIQRAVSGRYRCPSASAPALPGPAGGSFL